MDGSTVFNRGWKALLSSPSLLPLFPGSHQLASLSSCLASKQLKEGSMFILLKEDGRH